MKGRYRSYQIVENETIRRIDARRKKLNASVDQIAKRHRQERNIAMYALSSEGVLRIPGPRS
jgi:hypothetical protein